MDGDGRLLILGGGNDQVPLIQRAVEMGLETHVVDHNEHPAGRPLASVFHHASVRDVEAVLDIAERVRPDGVCSTSDAAIPFVSRVAERFGLVGHSPETAERVTDKAAMRAALRENGIACPSWTTARSAEEATNAGIRLPLVIKPADRSGSRGVQLVTDERDLATAFTAATAESFIGTAVIEEFVPGRQFNVTSISLEGTHSPLVVIEEWYEPPLFLSRQYVSPAPISALLEQRLRQVAVRALDALGVRWGPSECEMRVSPDGHIQVIEVAGRAGGTVWHRLIDRPTGFDYLRGVIDISLGRPVDLSTATVREALLLRNMYDPQDQGALERLSARWPQQVFSIKISGSAPTDQAVSFEQRTGHYFFSGSDPETCLESVETAMAEARDQLPIDADMAESLQVAKSDLAPRSPV